MKIEKGKTGLQEDANLFKVLDLNEDLINEDTLGDRAEAAAKSMMRYAAYSALANFSAI